MKASKNLKDFKGKVHLKDDAVVVHGKTITTKNPAQTAGGTKYFQRHQLQQ